MTWLTTRATLLERLQDPGDQQAWYEFDERYRDLILRYARSLGLQESDAEDVRQLVMMSLARSLPGFRYDRTRGRFAAYLRTAVRHAVASHLRRPNRAPEPLDSRVEVPCGAEDDDALWEREWMLHHYRTAMATIRRTFDAKSVRMFDALLEGGTTTAVADAFGASVQAVHKVKQRIRNRLRDLVAEQLAEEDDG